VRALKILKKSKMWRKTTPRRVSEACPRTVSAIIYANCGLIASPVSCYCACVAPRTLRILVANEGTRIEIAV
jgi:hypothetical protein